MSKDMLEGLLKVLNESADITGVGESMLPVEEVEEVEEGKVPNETDSEEVANKKLEEGDVTQQDLEDLNTDPATGEKFANKPKIEKLGKRITAIRRILQDSQAEKIDGKLVDMTTANLLNVVWGALKNPALKEKFETMSLKQLVDFAWRMTKSSSNESKEEKEEVFNVIDSQDVEKAVDALNKQPKIKESEELLLVKEYDKDLHESVISKDLTLKEAMDVVNEFGDEEKGVTVIARGISDEGVANQIAQNKKGIVSPDVDDEKKFMIVAYTDANETVEEEVSEEKVNEDELEDILKRKRTGNTKIDGEEKEEDVDTEEEVSVENDVDVKDEEVLDDEEEVTKVDLDKDKDDIEKEPDMNGKDDIEVAVNKEYVGENKDGHIYLVKMANEAGNIVDLEIHDSSGMKLLAAKDDEDVSVEDVNGFLQKAIMELDIENMALDFLRANNLLKTQEEMDVEEEDEAAEEEEEEVLEPKPEDKDLEEKKELDEGKIKVDYVKSVTQAIKLAKKALKDKDVDAAVKALEEIADDAEDAAKAIKKVDREATRKEDVKEAKIGIDYLKAMTTAVKSAKKALKDKDYQKAAEALEEVADDATDAAKAAQKGVRNDGRKHDADSLKASEVVEEEEVVTKEDEVEETKEV